MNITDRIRFDLVRLGFYWLHLGQSYVEKLHQLFKDRRDGSNIALQRRIGIFHEARSVLLPIKPGYG